MTLKKLPVRTCIVCRVAKNKPDLIRIVKNDTISFDFTGKQNGRGAYICNSEECLNKLLKQKVLSKVYKQNIPQTVYDNLKEQYFGHKQD